MSRFVSAALWGCGCVGADGGGKDGDGSSAEYKEGD
jgi:hypothetical protein